MQVKTILNVDGKIVQQADILAIANWNPQQKKPKEIAFYPARVLMQDFTSVPCIVDLAGGVSCPWCLGTRLIELMQRA